MLFGIKVVKAQQTLANAYIKIRDVFLLEANLDMITLTELKNMPAAIVARTSGTSIVVDDDVQVV